MEVFASTDSYYDSRFTAPLEEFLAGRDDVIPVFIYGSFSGDDVTALSAQGTDDLAATAGVASAPSFGFNRTAAPQADYFLYEHTDEPRPEDFTEPNTDSQDVTLTDEEYDGEFSVKEHTIDW